MAVLTPLFTIRVPFTGKVLQLQKETSVGKTTYRLCFARLGRVEEWNAFQVRPVDNEKE